MFGLSIFRAGFAGFFLLATASPAFAGIDVVSVGSRGDNPNGLSRDRAGAFTLDFNNAVGARFPAATIPGIATEPLGDTTRFVAIGPQTAPELSFNFGEGRNYLGLYWGSIEAGNTITFDIEGKFVAQYTGADLLRMFGGRTDNDLNRFVEFFFDDGMSFSTVTFTSAESTFELDNLAVGQVERVPEPASAALLSSALLGLGLLRRRQR